MHRVGLGVGRLPNPVLTPEQEAEINKQIDILTQQGRLGVDINIKINNIQLGY